MGVGRELIVGVDFDNTLIVYDELFVTMAREQGLLGAGLANHKRDVRDAVRRLSAGEVHWQKLQAAAYGPRIGEARLADGAMEFLHRCRQAKARLYVVSHKTELAGYDQTNTNLRHAAIAWMEAAGLFLAGGLRAEAVYFAATRREKVDRVRELACTHFIDDLEEVFLEDSFPPEVKRILYVPHAPRPAPPGIYVASSWKQIGELVFDAEN